jgi:protein tyrosine/serine phosphatase
LELEIFGIKTIINLRSFHTDWFKIHDLNFQYFHIWMKAWHAELEDIRKFLDIVRNPDNYPILVHCAHGSDRTGTMVAMYRIVLQGWSKRDAIQEMVHGGFGFHGIFENLVDWIISVDINQLKG